MAISTRVVTFAEAGGPSVLKIGWEVLSEPAAGEVCIRVQALGLNRAEAAFRSGEYLETPEFPSRIGYEAVGIVESTGSGVEGFKPGDKVYTLPGFSMSRFGVYAEKVVLPAEYLMLRPEWVHPLEAAAFMMAYLTAHGALVEHAQIGEGDVVLVGAASSSVGIAAIQLARYLGAVPIALSRSKAKIEALIDFGAEDVIHPSDPSLPDQVRSLSGDRGARLVFDPVAGPGVNTLADALAPGGELVLYGNLSGLGEQTPFPFYRAMKRGLSVRGFLVFELIRDVRRMALAKAFLESALAEGGLRPIVDRVFMFEEIAEAHRYLESNQQIGKVVIRVSDSL